MRKIIFIGCGVLLFWGIVCGAERVVTASQGGALTFTGSEDFTGEAFEIGAKEWQINWEYKAKEKQSPTFVLYVFPAGDKVNWLDMVKGPAFDAGGSTYLYRGEGKYYIKVRAKNLASWKVNIVGNGIKDSAPVPVTFSGCSDMTTTPFKISKKEFKLNYVMETADFGGQSIAVYPRGEMENYIEMETVGTGTGTKVLEGPGEYYIKVQCTRVKSWKIDVTE